MGLLWGFAPFLAFVIAERTRGIPHGLVIAAIVAAVLVARDAMGQGKSAKVLEIGTLLLFGGLAAYTFAAKATWSVLGVRLWVGAGLLVIVLASLAIRRPFTLQYAQEEVPQELWSTPTFIKTNYIITGVWAAAFALMVIADCVMLFVPSVPLTVGIVVTVIALAGAFYFTQWYPKQVSAKAA